MLTSCSLFSGLRSVSTVPAGRAAKASSVGAKTVNGPSPFKTSTRPAAYTAATNVPKLPAPIAVSTISFECPPASVVVAIDDAAAVIDAAAAIEINVRLNICFPLTK